MNSIRTAVASIAAAAAIGLSFNAQAQSVSVSHVLQADRAIPDTTTHEQRDEVMKLFTAHIGLWQTRDPSTYPYERLITEDAVYEYPYAQSEAARTIAGRAAVADAVRKLPNVASDWRVEDVKLFQTLHSDIFFVSYKLTSPQHAYAQRYMARITVKGGQIANYYEVWDRDIAGPASATALHN